MKRLKSFLSCSALIALIAADVKSGLAGHLLLLRFSPPLPNLLLLPRPQNRE